MIFKITSKSSKQNQVIQLDQFFQLPMTSTIDDILKKIINTNDAVQSYYNVDNKKYASKVYNYMLKKFKNSSKSQSLPVDQSLVQTYITQQMDQFLKTNTLTIQFSIQKSVLLIVQDNIGQFFTQDTQKQMIQQAFQTNKNVSKIPWSDINIQNFDVMLKLNQNGQYELTFDIDIDFSKYGVEDKEEDQQLDFSLFLYYIYHTFVSQYTTVKFQENLIDIVSQLFQQTYTPQKVQQFVLSNYQQKEGNAQ